jgi:hypothetical protein
MLGQDFVHDGCTILTHGFSRVVLALLKLATANGKHFSVICTGKWSHLQMLPLHDSFGILNVAFLSHDQHELDQCGL